MILFSIVVILIAAGFAAAVSGRWSSAAPRWIALAANLACLSLTLSIWVGNAGRVLPLARGAWLDEVDWMWIPQFGIHFHLAIDGLSLLLLALTFFIGSAAVLASWTEIQTRVGFFHLNLLWTLAGVSGVFLAIDLFLFYFSWELMLVPIYFLIAIWGRQRRVAAAMKFFLFTQLSGLLMLIAILTLAIAHQSATGVWTFEYEQLLGTPLSPAAAWWIMFGFFIGFAVKLPLFPLHTWLPGAHAQAPTAASLTGLLIKTGAYGMIRFVIPLFPAAAAAFVPAVMALAVAAILYGVVLAFSQDDFRRLLAYSSVSHLGFIVLGIFSWNELALQGAVMSIVCNAISIGGLFVLAGTLQQRMNTRDLVRMGGLWETMPHLSGAALFFALAALGLPGLGDFVGEFLVLLGTYRDHRIYAILATLGFLAAPFYALRLVQRAFQGPNTRHWNLPDLIPREGLIAGFLAASLLWLGLYPQVVLNTFAPALRSLQAIAAPLTARR